jgi:hypothetical protein
MARECFLRNFPQLCPTFEFKAAALAIAERAFVLVSLPSITLKTNATKHVNLLITKVRLLPAERVGHSI